MRISNMNATQKSGVFAAASAIVLILFLHAPWTGYVTEIPAQSPSLMVLLAKCPMTGRIPLDDPKFATKFEEQRKCEEAAELPAIPLAFDRWHTAAPNLPWFGQVMNFLLAIGALLTLAVLWVVLFNRTRERSAQH